MHVALIRGINVGRAKRVAMADLRSLVTTLGYSDVRTLLNSGNVVFSVPKSARGDAASRIEKAMAAELGVSARVTVLPAAEVAAIVTDNPLRRMAKDPTRLFVAVIATPADRALLKPLEKQDWAPDVLAASKRVAYLWCPNGMMDSRLSAEVNRALGDAVTTRNLATMTKLQALLES
jgi:uncharacterized protein (DUF1697 family)